MTMRSARRSVHLGQFRLTRLQVVNWGTFCGYKDFPVDERGVLLTGPSGSGKSSLLDAHSLVLLPTHDLRFNASADLTARGAKQGTRNVADYVRGAWSETNDEHERSQVRYLRGGKPTWSAVAATYDNGLGGITTAVVVKWFTGVDNAPESMKTMHQLHSGVFELHELNVWAERGFDTSWWKRTHPAAYPKSQHSYLTELGKCIGLDRSGAALALLGKAKAMKNVGDLNLFIRDNMLDRPPTFDAAETALASFTPLDEAYTTAKRAHDQEKVLREVPSNWQVYRESEHVRDRAETLRGAVLEHYVRQLHVTAIRAELDEIDAAVARLDVTAAQQDQARQDKQEALWSLEAQLREKNQGLQELEQRQKRLESEAAFARERYDRYYRYLERLGGLVPEDEAAFAAVRARLPDIAAQARDATAELEPRAHEAMGRQFTVKQEHEVKDTELQRLRSARTLIPGHAVARREHIARATGIAAGELPYAAELIDLAAGQERWRPAAEKVLRNYGMRLLVPERHQQAVSRFIDEHDMGGLVEYSIVTATSAHQPTPMPHTLAGKLTIDHDHSHGRWLAGQLANRFSHVCVDTAQELDDHRMAVTVNGTVKLPDNHFRKDDRPELTNPASWILGGNTAAKRQALEDEVAELAEAVTSATAEAGRLSSMLENSKIRVTAATEALQYSSWGEVDYATPTADAHEIGLRITQIRAGDVDLQRLEQQRDTTETEFTQAVAAWQRTTDRIREHGERQTMLADLLRSEENKPHALAEDDHLYLDEVYAAIGTPATVDRIADVRKLLDTRLLQRASTAQGEHDLAREKVRSAITRFLEHWRDSAPDDSGDVDRTGADFAALHTEIATRRLPQAMDRLQKMISEDMVPTIALLQRTIDTSADDIEQRIRWVNAGLQRVEFNDGTHLQIAYTANTSPEVKEFRRRVDELMQHAGRKTGPEGYVAQFRRVKALMARFTATEAAAERWRRNVLDVRNGYTFYGREVNADGVTVHTYRNTASNSGGEQEKLVAFCLAAALSYNLGESETDGRPRFGALMLDEAFSKSDEKYSSQALSAFAEFGFQLLIAAPIRMSGIVEPYIGQAILVDKRTTPQQARSTGKLATFGELADRRYAENEGASRALA